MGVLGIFIMFLLIIFVVDLMKGTFKKNPYHNYKTSFPPVTEEKEKAQVLLPTIVVGTAPEPVEVPPPDTSSIPSFNGRVARYHDLDRYVEKLQGKVDTMCAAVPHLPDGDMIHVAGVVESIKKKKVRKTGEEMAIGVLNDPTGSCEFVMFSNTYQCYRNLRIGDVVIVKGYVKDHSLTVKFITIIGYKRPPRTKKAQPQLPDQLAFVVKDC
jgi:hypothetical protein